ncbi:MAG: hypothetical protein RPT11_10305 [Bermanella sp.]
MVAKTEKDPPKYMRLSANTQYELAQGIEAAAAAAQLGDEAGLTPSCYQICYQQLTDQLQEEYLLKTPASLNLERIEDNKALQAALLSWIPLCAAQWQLQGGDPAASARFQAEFKLVVARSLRDGLDIMSARDIWRFDIQRNIEEVQKYVFAAVDQYTL